MQTFHMKSTIGFYFFWPEPIKIWCGLSRLPFRTLQCLSKVKRWPDLSQSHHMAFRCLPSQTKTHKTQRQQTLSGFKELLSIQSYNISSYLQASRFLHYSVSTKSFSDFLKIQRALQICKIHLPYTSTQDPRHAKTSRPTYMTVT